MANKRFFILIFATLLLSAAHKASAFETSPISLNEKPVTCNAPAPTNFRITERSANFIVLAWDPAWQGATHTLAILESNGQGGWIGVDTLHQVTGDSYTAGGLTPGQTYRFVIATNCEDGSPSLIKWDSTGSTLIIDLSIDGKNPLTPHQHVPCENIPLNMPWKGFRVAHVGGSPLLRNEFEFAPEGFPENGVIILPCAI
jgi:Fibronectin type III domain.